MIPSGNITFLFSDIEGSTLLAQDFPDSLQSALEIHNSILRNAVESNHGFIFEIVGDAFCCAFEKAEDAVKAAVEAQTGLSEEKWKDAVIKVRMGIHSGSAEWNGSQYMGYITIARTSRVMSSAFGEQIIISNPAYESAKDKFDSAKEKNISFRDLGERRLKDVIQPIRLYQIESPGLRQEFPPLKTLDSRPNNLPIQLTSFIGREDIMKNVKNLFSQTHLLSIIGSGGSGKTRLALQTGADMIDDFENGVYIAEIAPVTDPAFILQTLINSIGLKEEPGKSPESLMTDFLGDKEILLILDNCEHLINECASIAEKLISNCPNLRIIATSREALNCSGEVKYNLPTLKFPDNSVKITPEKLVKYESVRLFIERALLVNPNFRVDDKNASALGEICRKLDGIPLAIELAAARIKVLSVEKIQERLDDRFNLLSSGKRTALPRQQTLKALIDWSYELLSEDEKILWRRLSVFSGGWTLETAEEICSDERIDKEDILDFLSQLAEKSIIIYDEERDRFRILETLKDYGKIKLEEAGESDKIFKRHLDFFTKFAEKAYNNYIGAVSDKWIKLTESEMDNLRSALNYAIMINDIEYCLMLTNYLSNYWILRELLQEGLNTAKKILSMESGRNFPSLRAKLLYDAGVMAHDMSLLEDAGNYLTESHEIVTTLDDVPFLARVKSVLGLFMINSLEYKKGETLCLEAKTLYEQLGNKKGEANSLMYLSYIHIDKGDFLKARVTLNKAIEIKNEIVSDRDLAYARIHLANIEIKSGNMIPAKELLDSAKLILDIAGGKQLMFDLYEGYCDLYHSLGDFNKAEEMLLNAGNAIKDLNDVKREMAINFSSSHLLFDRGRFDEASEIQSKNLSLIDKSSLSTDLLNMKYAGEIFIQRKEFDKARESFKTIFKLIKKIHAKYHLVHCLESLSLLSEMENKLERSVILINYSAILRKRYNYNICECEKRRFEILYRRTDENIQKTLMSGDEDKDLIQCIEYAESDL